MFRLQADYETAGDQQQAIDQLVEQLNEGQERCVLLGVTGSGKTFAMAKVIEELQLPTLILSHNKTLARQIWQEMSGLSRKTRLSTSLATTTTTNQRLTSPVETCTSTRSSR